MCSIIFLAYTLKLPIQTLLSVAPTCSVFCATLNFSKTSTPLYFVLCFRETHFSRVIAKIWWYITSNYGQMWLPNYWMSFVLSIIFKVSMSKIAVWMVPVKMIGQSNEQSLLVMKQQENFALKIKCYMFQVEYVRKSVKTMLAWIAKGTTTFYWWLDS